jgi:transposase, IS5 family
VPDEATVCRFPPPARTHGLGRRLFDEFAAASRGARVKIAADTIVDAKKSGKARDPDTHQTRKGNQWYFGMTAHFGVNRRTKLIYAAVATPANVPTARY